jgi:hypothetical protein
VEGPVKDLLPLITEGAPKELPEELRLLKEEEAEDLLTLPEGGLMDRLPPITEGALKELPEELRLLKEGEGEGLLTLPEGGLMDRLPLLEGVLEGPSKDLC